MEGLRDDLLKKCPGPEPGTRFFFNSVPSEVGFLVGDGPSLRVWYEDRTLSGGFWREFHARGAKGMPGSDRFLRYDDRSGWVEIHVGPEDIETNRRLNPDWLVDHAKLAQTLGLGEDWKSAREEYAKLHHVVPGNPSFPFMAGVASLALGDSAEARQWLTKAVANPSADSEILAVARSIGIRTDRLP